MIRYILISTFLTLLSSCNSSSEKIIDHYYFYKYVDHDYNGNTVNAKNVLMCKLASKNDPFIIDVENILWNSNTIVSKTINGYFIIESGTNGLCCSCNNKIIGPLNKIEFNKYISETGFEPDNEKKIK